MNKIQQAFFNGFLKAAQTATPPASPSPAATPPSAPINRTLPNVKANMGNAVPSITTNVNKGLDIVAKTNNVMGKTVNMASRAMPSAEPMLGGAMKAIQPFVGAAEKIAPVPAAAGMAFEVGNIVNNGIADTKDDYAQGMQHAAFGTNLNRGPISGLAHMGMYAASNPVTSAVLGAGKLGDMTGINSAVEQVGNKLNSWAARAQANNPVPANRTY